MKDNARAALILALGLSLAGLLNGGIYQIVEAGGGSGSQNPMGDPPFLAYRLNRFTGDVALIGRDVMLPVRPRATTSSHPTAN